MFILKKTPRQHGLHEPFRHENHARPVTRRQLLGAGFLSGPAMVLAPAWLGSLLKPQTASAVDQVIDSLRTECNIPGSIGAGGGPLPFIVIDLAGGANLMGSEALAGASSNGVGGQLNFITTAGYAKLGLPGNMVPTSSTFIDQSLGMAFHSDSAILRGIKSRAQAPTLAGVNGVVIPAMSQNDTGNDTLNPMYGIAKAAAGLPGANTRYGSLLTLIGTQSTVSGGNSASPAMTSIGGSDPQLQPTKIASAADCTGLVSTSGSPPTADTLAAQASQAKISAGTAQQGGTLAQAPFNTSAMSTTLIPGGNTANDLKLKEQIRCAYVKSAYTADAFSNPASLNPTLDTNIVGSGGIFSTAEYQADGDIRKAAAVMKLVVSGYAGAGTITLGGYDYHSGNRSDGEQRNEHAGVIIGAILDYARRIGSAVMIQVISDGSLTSTGMVDNSTAGRGKLGWQGDSQQVAGSLLLAYSPRGRPAMALPGNQIGYLNGDGTVNAMSSPAANANNLLVQTVMLNWMAANGTAANFAALFPTQGLGAARDAVTAFTKIT